MLIFTFIDNRMKFRITLLIFLGLATTGFAQTKAADTLVFNNRVSSMMNQWVVFPKANNADKYPYGFVYVDEMAGFTFQLSGNFVIANHKYVIDTALQKKLRFSMMKYRLAPNTKLVAVLPVSHYAELGITGAPDWVKIYNNYTDTLAHNVAIGRHLNSMNDCEYALTYLLKTYAIKPHAPGLEFELGYAYNVLGRFDDAIKVLDGAVKNNPSDIFSYKEFGYAYLHKKDFDKAVSVYKDGITACGDNGHPTEKSEMALNIAAAYRNLKNDDQYKEWMTKAKSWAPVNSDIYKMAVQMGF